jgi:hypothetical protein
MSFGPSGATEAPADSRLGRLITCPVDQLRPHPRLVRLRIVPSAHDLSVAIGQSHQAMREPLTITQDHYILVGYAQWKVARRQSEATLPCIQLDLTEEEALLWIIQKHQRSSSINDFGRILLALELEPSYKARARTNQQLGGKLKGSSNLTKANRLNVRSEVAAAAGVSPGNVFKVKQLAMHAHPALLQALREGEVSINLASGWLKIPEKQLDQLRLYRLYLGKRGLTRKIDSLLRAHRPTHPAREEHLDIQRIGSALAAMSPERKTSVLVSAIEVTGEVLLLSTGLLQALESLGELLQ